MTVSDSPKNAFAKVSPLLTTIAVDRTNDAALPGAYCAQRHVTLVDDVPIVMAMADLAELVTKTNAQSERDDSSEPCLLELQTKTKAQVEQEDQDFNLHLLGQLPASRARTSAGST